MEWARLRTSTLAQSGASFPSYSSDVMATWTEIALLVFLVIAVAAAILLSGCTSDSQQADNQQAGSLGSGQGGANADAQAAAPAGWQGQPGNFTRGGQFGNLTAEQRQQMAAQRMQQAAAACEGKNDGDSCAMQGQRGNSAGTCKTLNETLSCMGAGGIRGGNHTGMPRAPGDQ